MFSLFYLVIFFLDDEREREKERVWVDTLTVTSFHCRLSLTIQVLNSHLSSAAFSWLGVTSFLVSCMLTPAFYLILSLTWLSSKTDLNGTIFYESSTSTSSLLNNKENMVDYPSIFYNNINGTSFFSSNTSLLSCPAIWDDLLCWDSVPAGSVAMVSCRQVFDVMGGGVPPPEDNDIFQGRNYVNAISQSFFASIEWLHNRL